MKKMVKVTVANSKRNSVNNNGTKVICPKCGAEIMIPEHEHEVSGMAIGKDSGLGTVELQIVDSTCSNDSIGSMFDKIIQIANETGDADLIAQINSVRSNIGEKFVDVIGIPRRWVTSQCLRMLNGKNYNYNRRITFKGYFYTWKVLMNDLKVSVKAYQNNDKEELSERMKFYNKDLAISMIDHYSRTLTKALDKWKRFSCKGELYIKLKCRDFNNGRGLFVHQFGDFTRIYSELVYDVTKAKNPIELYNALVDYVNFISGINLRMTNNCNEFYNTYKAVGAYYTMKDLILFENCLIPDTFVETPTKIFNKKNSIAALDNLLDEAVKDDIRYNGYKLLGVLKAFLEFNEFDYESTVAKWARQSEERRAARNNNRGNRRINK